MTGGAGISLKIRNLRQQTQATEQNYNLHDANPDPPPLELRIKTRRTLRVEAPAPGALNKSLNALHCRNAGDAGIRKTTAEIGLSLQKAAYELS